MIELCLPIPTTKKLFLSNSLVSESPIPEETPVMNTILE
jgi:hypothetical protein